MADHPFEIAVLALSRRTQAYLGRDNDKVHLELLQTEVDSFFRRLREVGDRVILAGWNWRNPGRPVEIVGGVAKSDGNIVRISFVHGI